MDRFEERHLAAWCERRAVTSDGARAMFSELRAAWYALDEATREDVRRMGWTYLAQLAERVAKV